MLALGLAAACSDGEQRLRIVAAAHPWQAQDCDEVPLQITEWPSRETRFGPSDRYITLELSPSGDSVAASRWNWNHCLDHEEVPDSERTYSLLSIDVTTLEVTELLVGDFPMEMIQWSADGRHVAFTTIERLTIFDVDRGVVLREIDLDSRRGWQNRGLFIGPDGSNYLFVYASGRSFVGIPRDPGAEPATWTPECSRPGTLFALRVKATGSGEVTAYYLCGDDDDPPPYHWEAMIDLETAELSPGQSSAEVQEWLSAPGVISDQVREDHPGAAVWLGTATDHRQELTFVAATYSASGEDVGGFVRENGAYPTDAEFAVVIRTSDSDFIYAPVQLDLGTAAALDPVGPLHDVVILDE